MKGIIILLLILIIFYLNKRTFTNLSNNVVKQSQFIPKLLFQTYHKEVPTHITQNINMYASDYKRLLLNDEEGYEFIDTHFNENVLQKYEILTGAHKADLLRYCLLYIHGGVYLDIKSILIRNLNELVDHNKMSDKPQIYTAISHVDHETCYQGFIATTRGNPLFLSLIDQILKTPIIQLKSYYLLITKQMYDTINKNKNDLDVTFYNEYCENADQTNKDLDRYGYFCVLRKDNGEVMMNVRDPEFGITW
jgi:hypothetical protein